MYDLNHIYKVGNLISKLREEKGFSQSELGSKLGVTNKAVSRWENGRGYPDTSILLKLAEVLEITVDELLKGELSISKPKHEVINKNIISEKKPDNMVIRIKEPVKMNIKTASDTAKLVMKKVVIVLEPKKFSKDKLKEAELELAERKRQERIKAYWKNQNGYDS